MTYGHSCTKQSAVWNAQMQKYFQQKQLIKLNSVPTADVEIKQYVH